MRNDKSLKRGESDYCMAGDISVYNRKDRGAKPVLLASNFHDPREETTVLRTNVQGNREKHMSDLPFELVDITEGELYAPIENIYPEMEQSRINAEEIPSDFES
ncbi:unnamed protein product [Acanthoscelides obtectus]|uniref:Uncharacterized protein n=1 Tax=Acanthoscelides obtectus TaxID=200917 RepID=A0A9P0LDC8_ACAOB|nr:unnamed protein product [Acanthoscelides obtectus]CAK1622428.1 hypothetical protein AOBTE_LOCUS1473 [Acanthoscelides obtectus]